MQENPHMINFIYNSIKKNKILWNKFNQGGIRLAHSTIKHHRNVLKKTEVRGKAPVFTDGKI